MAIAMRGCATNAQRVRSAKEFAATSDNRGGHVRVARIVGIDAGHFPFCVTGPSSLLLRGASTISCAPRKRLRILVGRPEEEGRGPSFARPQYDAKRCEPAVSSASV